MTKIRYNTFEPCDSVIVLGAGPSLNKNLPLIKNYIANKDKTIILACNYNYSLESNFTVFIDRLVFISNIEIIQNKNIIITNRIYNYKKCRQLIDKTNRNFYLIDTNENISICKFDKTTTSFELNKIIVDENGKVGHNLGNAGQTALFAAHYFKPKKIIALGFDGMDKNKQKKFDGREMTLNEKNRKTIKYKVDYMQNRLIPFLKEKSIEIFAFDNDRFWGIKRDSIKTISISDLIQESKLS